jgi:hypothetical protein
MNKVKGKNEIILKNIINKREPQMTKGKLHTLMVYIGKTNIHKFTVFLTSNDYETCSKHA